VVAVTAVWLPESPRFLVARSNLSLRNADLLRRLNIMPSAVAKEYIDISGSSSWKMLFREGYASQTVLLWVIFFTSGLGLFLYSVWLLPDLVRLGMSPPAAASASNLGRLGSIAAAFYVGPLIDRFGPHRTLAIHYTAGAFCVVAIAALPLPEAALPWATFFAGMTFVGSAYGANAAAGALYPARMRAVGIGWPLFILRLGAFAAPMLAEHLSPQQVLLAAGSSALISAMAAALLGRRRGAERSPAATTVAIRRTAGDEAFRTSDSGAISIIDLGNVTGGFGFVSTANSLLFLLAVGTPIWLVVVWLKSGVAPESLISGVAAVGILAFAAVIAWKNMNILHAAVQKWTVTSFLLVAVVFFIGALIDPLHGSDWSMRESVYPGLVALSAAVSLALLRHRRIGALQIRLVDFLRTMSVPLHASPVRALQPANRARGWLMMGGSLLTMFVVRLLYSLAYLGAKIPFWPYWGLVDPLSLFLLICARRCFQPKAETVLTADPRPPVLFLRSFSDDERIQYLRSEKSFMDFSLESRIATHFNASGPFIAVGSPGEILPAVGAARAALSDREWQGRVLEWMDRSCLIVLVAGTTHWISWELGKVIERDHAEKLILLFPNQQQSRLWSWSLASRWSADFNTSVRIATVIQAFRGTAWEGALRDISQGPGERYIRSIVFAAGGGVTVVRSKSDNRNASHLAALVAHYVVIGSSTTPNAVSG
jgi:hypothetical protein